MVTATVEQQYKCSVCGRDTEWDPELGDRPLCQECWDVDVEKNYEVAAYQRRYCQEHREEVAAYHRRYYQEHREEVAALQRDYREKHKDKIAALQRDKNNNGHNGMPPLPAFSDKWPEAVKEPLS